MSDACSVLSTEHLVQVLPYDSRGGEADYGCRDVLRHGGKEHGEDPLILCLSGMLGRVSYLGGCSAFTLDQLLGRLWCRSIEVTMEESTREVGNH